jgi:hypothetical protein
MPAGHRELTAWPQLSQGPPQQQVRAFIESEILKVEDRHRTGDHGV